MQISAKIASQEALKKDLDYLHITILCLGHIIGAGIFILTGVAARNLAG